MFNTHFSPRHSPLRFNRHNNHGHHGHHPRRRHNHHSNQNSISTSFLLQLIIRLLSQLNQHTPNPNPNP
ncbi:MAG: hypothetical protein KAH22_07680, partial [Thiotrichaceae bacterium]|nr:hypothetical protein [Thiotrichaceae bacterium]